MSLGLDTFLCIIIKLSLSGFHVWLRKHMSTSVTFYPHICTVFVCINASHVISTLDDAKDGRQHGAVLMLGGLCGQKCKLSGKCL